MGHISLFHSILNVYSRARCLDSPHSSALFKPLMDNTVHSSRYSLKSEHRSNADVVTKFGHAKLTLTESNFQGLILILQRKKKANTCYTNELVLEKKEKINEKKI